MIKTTGAEWKAFNADTTYWSEFCVEDEIVTVNGSRVDEYSDYIDAIADADKVTVDGGFVADLGSNKEYSLNTFFKRWRKQRTTEYLSVEVAKDKAEAVRDAIKAAGGKVK